VAKNFDDILKKGKEKAIPHASKQELFRQYVYNLVVAIHTLNELFANDLHNISFSHSFCDKCKKPTFILHVKNINDPEQTIRYHESTWKVVGKGTYLCDMCKKG